MWRDVRWHRELTDLIKGFPILPELQMQQATRLQRIEEYDKDAGN